MSAAEVFDVGPSAPAAVDVEQRALRRRRTWLLAITAILFVGLAFELAVLAQHKHRTDEIQNGVNSLTTNVSELNNQVAMLNKHVVDLQSTVVPHPGSTK